MKKGIIFLTSILIILLVVFINNTMKEEITTSNISKQGVKSATKYYDFSSIKTISTDYSYSTIFISEKTSFDVIKNSGDVSISYINGDGIQLPYIEGIEITESVSILITNSAINKDGELLDVLVTIDNVESYNGNDYSISFGINEEKIYLANQKDPSTEYKSLTKIGDSIHFILLAHAAKCDFTITYYIAGTYNKATKIGEYGKIDYINSFYYDIDTSNWPHYSSSFLNGDEGFSPQVGESLIYYNKNANDRLYESNNGIATSITDSSSDGIWYKNSAFMLTNKFENSTFKFTYGGAYCGMGYSFESPYPYDMNQPVKKVDKIEATTKEQLIYSISQYVPNNYYGNDINFSQVFPYLYSSTRFESFSITDTINKYLSFSIEDVTIKNELGIDVTSYFNITKNGQQITASVNNSYFSKPTFYNHVYTLNIPVTINDTSNLTTISNEGKINYSFSNNSIQTLTSNSVSTKIYYNLIVNHYIKNSAAPYTEPYITKKYTGDTYITNPIDITNYELISSPINASGTITNNVVVDYYYQKKTATLTIKYLEYNTNMELLPEDVSTVYYGDTYITKESNNITNNYVLKTKTNNYEGVVNTPTIEVIYYYEKKNSQLDTIITKEGPNSITSTNETIDYTITFKTNISDYLGNVTIEIVDTLPLSIDENQSLLDGGIYNSDNKTITWLIKKDNIDASINSQSIIIEKNISIIYKDLNPQDTIITNNIKGKIVLDNNEQEIENKENTFIDIKGKIIIHHYLVNTKNKIVDDIITEDKVGNTYLSKEINKDGYILVSSPNNRVHIYKEGISEYTYTYRETGTYSYNPDTSKIFNIKNIIFLSILFFTIVIIIKKLNNKILKI